MSQGKVLIAAPVHVILLEGLTNAGYDLIIADDITQQKAFDLIIDCVGVITSTRLQLNKDLIDVAPKLRFIGRMGSGMEVIDLTYAAARGILCYGSPEGNCNAVGEHALGMLLALTKRITWSNQEIKEGKWLREENRGIELEGKTMGIIGYGHTGKSFVKKLRGFDMNILVYDKYQVPSKEPYIEICENLTPIFEKADFVSFHVPIQNDTHYLFNESFVLQMSKPFVLINTSRGEVVDPAVLYKFIHSGKLKAACMDVWEDEPLSKMSIEARKTFDQLAKMPNVIFTPHIAGYSYEALYKMSVILLERITK
jgi:D-3-phosphoglycerate dehydrogenase / 2-oxoglutarate reductase